MSALDPMTILGAVLLIGSVASAVIGLPLAMRDGGRR